MATGERPADTGWRYKPDPVEAKNVISEAIRERVKKIRKIVTKLAGDGSDPVLLAEIASRLVIP